MVACRLSIPGFKIYYSNMPENILPAGSDNIENIP
jgi:hypothetical protein